MGFRDGAPLFSNHLAVYLAGLFFLSTPLQVDAADQPELMLQSVRRRSGSHHSAGGS